LKLFPPTPSPRLLCPVPRWRGRAPLWSPCPGGGTQGWPSRRGFAAPPILSVPELRRGLAWVPAPTPIALLCCPRAAGQLLAAPRRAGCSAHSAAAEVTGSSAFRCLLSLADFDYPWMCEGEAVLGAGLAAGSGGAVFGTPPSCSTCESVLKLHVVPRGQPVSRRHPVPCLESCPAFFRGDRLSVRTCPSTCASLSSVGRGMR